MDNPSKNWHGTNFPNLGEHAFRDDLLIPSKHRRQLETKLEWGGAKLSKILRYKLARYQDFPKESLKKFQEKFPYEILEKSQEDHYRNQCRYP